MELNELKDLWEGYDKKITESTLLNKKILRKLLQSKPENRLNWIRLRAGLNLILPIILILIFIVPNIKFRNEAKFIIGLLLFVFFSTITYYWSIKYYLLLRKTDFANPITVLKKNISEIEKYKIRITKMGYILMPFAAIGIFLIFEIPFFSKESLLPVGLMAIVLIVSAIYTFKYSIYERFQKINREIEEIEQLEK